MSFRRTLESGPLERDIRALWRAYESRPIRSIRHVWRYIRLHWEYSLEPPALTHWPLLIPETRTPLCLQCTNTCCQGPKSTVLLRLVDVALFVDRGWTEYMTHDKPSFSKEQLAASPALQAMVHSFHWRVFPVLKQKPESGHCVFLDDALRCGIHASRPWVCRGFPYTLDLERMAIGWGDRCQTFGDVPDALPEGAEAIRDELRHAVVHSFFVEKIRDLVLVSMYQEELAAMGLLEWLRVD